MRSRTHRRHLTYLMRRVEKKLVMLLLAATCISIDMAERFEAVENKWEKIADMLEGRNDAFKEAT